MNRWVSSALVLPLVVVTAAPAGAEVKSREKSLVKLEGVLGGVVRVFGGKAAKEGVVSTAAVKGNRKATKTDTRGEIVDLTEQKVYTIDYKDKSYTVRTFDEIREEMRKAAEEAEKQRQQAEAKQPPAEQQPAAKPDTELDVDFDVKETGQKKTIAGYEAREVIMTVTLREKGKKLEESGGFVMTADSWLGPDIPALKELYEFDQRYFQQLHGPEARGLTPEQAAQLAKAYPMVARASERLKTEGAKLQGTPLATTTTFDAVKSKEAMDAQAQAASSDSSSSKGLGGILARKIAKKEEPKARATVFTIEQETQEVSTSVAPGDLDIPAGFKQKS
jgi:hypothetical protein